MLYRMSDAEAREEARQIKLLKQQEYKLCEICQASFAGEGFLCSDCLIKDKDRQIAELEEKLDKEIKEREGLYPAIDEFRATIERYRKAEIDLNVKLQHYKNVMTHGDWLRNADEIIAENTALKDKLHRRNLQIKGLSRKLAKFNEIVLDTTVEI